MSTTYKDLINQAMKELGADPQVLFVGYNVKYGLAGGSLSGVPESQLIEMPLAENLMAGAAIGMALEGFIPVLYFERADFLTNALDAIVNHLDKIASLSQGQFTPCCLIRVVVGNKLKPLYTGETHTQNFAPALRRMVSFPIHELRQNHCVLGTYQWALAEVKAQRQSVMVFEFKDLYDQV